MKTRKNKQLVSILMLLGILITACNNNDDLVSSDVAGVYEGTLTTDVVGKSISSKSNSIATAVVTLVGDKIEVHCYNDDFDTTIMLNLYEDGDMINTCLTGTDFSTMYGHMMGQGNILNGNMQNMGSEWIQHLNNEHQEGDEHFGGFNMEHHSFNYIFETSNGNFHFKGTKK